MADRLELMKSAIESGDVVTVRRLLASGYSLEETFDDSGPKTALQFAALKGTAEIIEVLIDGGADVHVNKERFATPLHIAVLAGRVDICKLLLDRGANPNLPCRASGMTPLHFASGSDDGSDAVAQLLVQSGALTDVVDFAGRTALHHAVIEPFRIEVVKALLAGRANPNLLDSTWKTPLHRVEDADTFNLLIEHGADLYLTPKNPPKNYRTPLDEGIANGGLEIAAACQGILATKTAGEIHEALAIDVQDSLGGPRGGPQKAVGMSPL